MFPDAGACRKALSQTTCICVLAPLLLFAPVQCPAHREPRRVREEPPAEAVYHSAEHLRDLGYDQAEEATLRYLISRYPQSRWAERAREDLEQEE
jgi:outer membrane protein assembly factor BamD (BamD/ComL family)